MSCPIIQLFKILGDQERCEPQQTNSDTDEDDEEAVDMEEFEESDLLEENDKVAIQRYTYTQSGHGKGAGNLLQLLLKKSQKNNKISLSDDFFKITRQC